MNHLEYESLENYLTQLINISVKNNYQDLTADEVIKLSKQLIQDCEPVTTFTNFIINEMLKNGRNNINLSEIVKIKDRVAALKIKNDLVQITEKKS
jgi:hypothetical protein